jgi:hypothetical protein
VCQESSPSLLRLHIAHTRSATTEAYEARPRCSGGRAQSRDGVRRLSHCWLAHHQGVRQQRRHNPGPAGALQRLSQVLPPTFGVATAGRVGKCTVSTVVEKNSGEQPQHDGEDEQPDDQAPEDAPEDTSGRFQTCHSSDALMAANWPCASAGTRTPRTLRLLVLSGWVPRHSRPVASAAG